MVFLPQQQSLTHCLSLSLPCFDYWVGVAIAAELQPAVNKLGGPAVSEGLGLAPKRHRRPSVRLGDIGDQSTTIKSWRLNSNSKTRPLTNLVTTTTNTNGSFNSNPDYSTDTATTNLAKRARTTLVGVGVGVGVAGEERENGEQEEEEGFRNFAPEQQQHQTPVHSDDDLNLDAWHGHNGRSGTAIIRKEVDSWFVNS